MQKHAQQHADNTCSGGNCKRNPFGSLPKRSDRRKKNEEEEEEKNEEEEKKNEEDEVDDDDVKKRKPATKKTNEKCVVCKKKITSKIRRHPTLKGGFWGLGFRV